MDNAHIALLPGDGIGPEVIAEAQKVLESVAERFSKTLEFEEGAIGGIAIDETGSSLPDATLELCKRTDAIMLGAVGGPKWSDPNAKVRPEEGLLGLRKELGCFANIRPINTYPALREISPVRFKDGCEIDFVIVRELTGGLYFGKRGLEEIEGGERAFDTMSYETSEIERIVRIAAEIAAGRRGKLTLVDKANVLESSRLWRRTTERIVKEEYSELELDWVLVDAAAMFLIQTPERFDVIVTENLFGDILSDEASVLSGSMGLLASASIGDGGPGIYEPIHGSAPDIAGKGIANPLGMILSAAMMCRSSLGWLDEAQAIEDAVASAIASGARTTDFAGPDEKKLSTNEMGSLIADAVSKHQSVATN